MLPRHHRGCIVSSWLPFGVTLAARALLADFDFAWLPGVINQKVVDFEAEDSVWGVCTTRDDMYDLFMLSYHLVSDDDDDEGRAAPREMTVCTSTTLPQREVSPFSCLTFPLPLSAVHHTL